jgi:mediator of RNA polymerase II transcription subunit 25
LAKIVENWDHNIDPRFKNALTDLTSAVVARGIHLSVISPRKLPFLCRLFTACGGDLEAEKNAGYAKHPSHLVPML